MSPDAQLERYAAVLKDAEQIRGVSLARDGWRRLKRNRVATASLFFLAVLSLLAVLTPLLPLQSPYTVDTNKAFAPPTAHPFFIDTLRMDARRGAAGAS